MARICMFAKNSASRDTRILKEADSLASAGHEVTVIGFTDAVCSDPETVRASGAKILRQNRNELLNECQSLRIRFIGFLKKLKDPPKIKQRIKNRIWNGIWLLLGSLVYAVVLYTVSPTVSTKLETPASTILVYGILNLIYILLWLRYSQILIACFVYALLLYAVISSLPSATPVNIILPLGLLNFVFAVLWVKFSSWQKAAKEINGHSKTALLTHLSTPEQSRIKQALDKYINRLRNKTADYVIKESLVKRALQIRPNIIHCHDLEPLPGAVAAKRKLKCLLVLDAHEIYEAVAQGNEQIAARYRRILRAGQGDVDHFITINDSIANFYAENYQLPPATIIKNAAVRTPSFTYDGRLHKAAGLRPRQKILLYQGGYAEKRGLQKLVAASAYLNNDWTLVMMGWGKLESDLRKLGDNAIAASVKRRSLPCVIFIDPAPQNELVHWSAGGTVGVIPYERVGLNHLFCSPNKLWEYPSAGVPILCSPLVEMRKTVEEFGLGWVLPEADLEPEALAAVINALQEKQIAKARTACARYMELDGWHKYEVRLIELYARAGYPLPHRPAQVSKRRMRVRFPAESRLLPSLVRNVAEQNRP